MGLKLLETLFNYGMMAAGLFIIINYGFLWFMIYLIPFSLFQLWRQRDQVSLIRDVTEMKIFGKVLDKDQWKAGEMKEWHQENKNYKRKQVKN